jgi:hypothetical protein
MTRSSSLTAVTASSLKGVATLDFGSGSMDASAVLTGIGSMLADDMITVSTRIEATPEHNVDDFLIDPIRVDAHSIVAGVGFTITGRMDNAPANGTYIINWVVN